MDLQALRSSLAPLELRPEEQERIDGRRVAAVSILLRTDASSVDVLLIRRAIVKNDRWSGQIGLPGGHRENSDASLLATAVRETHEEVGIDLELGAETLGRMEKVQAKARGKMLAMSITPFVFRATKYVNPVPGPEVDVAFWFPLRRARDGELDSSHTYRSSHANFHMPAWVFEGCVVWGLTYEILSEFNRLVDA